jgi:stearoyl-CoA desaturase (delta-9 desaturase)
MKLLRGLGIGLLHVPILALPWRPLTWRHGIAFVVGYLLVAFALGGGLHRYFAHRAFRTSRAFQLLLGVLAAAYFADPIGFAGRHRHHHRWADTERDLVGPHHGVWAAWIGHLLADDFRERELGGATADLRRYPELVWLHRWSLVPGLAAVGLVWLVAGYTVLAVAYCLPLCLLGVHGISAVNYVCHRFGPRRFPTPDHSTNHPVLGVLLLGEGWHNNHHRFPGSARCGLRWWELDIVYQCIRLLSAVGLVWAVREIPRGPRVAIGRSRLVARADLTP